jgi:co-chaperonin GroES (HSP10)
MTVINPSEIYLPDDHSVITFYGLILDCGNEVEEKFIKPNRLAYFDIKQCKAVSRKGKEIYYIFDENSILLVRDSNNFIRPLGRRALIQRDTDEFKTYGGVIIPACRPTTDQSKKGFYYRGGIHNGEVIDFICNPGDRIEIQTWDRNIYEIEVDGKYMLSVPLDLIVYKET